MSIWTEIKDCPAPTDREIELRGRIDTTRKVESAYVARWDDQYGAFVSRGGAVVMPTAWKERGTGKNADRRDIPRARRTVLLTHLRQHSAIYGMSRTDARSSPHLSQTMGIRNIPDAIRKLRKLGHEIMTTRGPAKVGAITYDDVAIYTYINRNIR